MIREALEDFKRHKDDARVNNRQCSVLRGTEWVSLAWSKLRVGDVVKCSNQEEFPADLMLIASAKEQGMCYVETSNLDGETNLKIRKAPDATREFQSPEKLAQLRGSIEYEGPNNRLYVFEGTLTVDGQNKVPIDVNATVLRGSVLRNTPYCVGLVLYAGEETKLAKNSVPARAKSSNVMRFMNRCIILVFFCLVALCTASVVMNRFLNVEQEGEAWYLGEDETSSSALAVWITFLILYNSLVPISLDVAVELVKGVQAELMKSDLKLYWEESDTPMMWRTTNLNEDLGQIEYIFSDKTGTLTQNLMEFKKCSIAGTLYLEPDSVDDLPPNSKSDVWSRLMDKVRSGDGAEEIDAFMSILVACHTVIPEAQDDGTVVYQAASPDEGALVEAAKKMGWEFVSRTSTSLKFLRDGKEKTYDVFAINEFTSARKRMSILVKDRDGGPYTLLLKGADDVVFDKLGSKDKRQQIDEATRHVGYFATLGLRTLILAKRTLDDEAAKAWLARFNDAATALSNREQRLAEAAEEIEEKMDLVGVTAVEDKLQEGVPSTIAQLQRANIKIWMLTGDKQETAINIGYASRLLTSRMQLLTISGNTLEHTRKVIAARYSEVQSWRMQYGSNPVKRARRPLAIVVDGSALHFCDEDRAMRRLFLSMVSDCSAVVACRVSPLQKANIVRLVKVNMVPQPITLAIGDGANDVSMIQEAHVGIGVSGREGMQAVRAADYAIAQFSFLRRLLLVHGFWNYQRVTFVILYTIYKQGIFVFSLFFYNIYNGMTGTSLYDISLILCYPVCYSFLPILFVGIMDQSVRDQTANDYPQCYYVGQQGRLLNLKQMCMWEGTAFLHALVVFMVTLNFFCISSNARAGVKSDTPSPSAFSDDLQGRDSDMYTLGACVNFMVVIVVNCKLLLSMHMFTYPALSLKGFVDFICSLGAPFITCLCVLSWFCFTALFASTSSVPMQDETFIGVFSRAIGSMTFWLCALLVPVLALMPDVVMKTYVRTYAPETLHLLQEVSATEKRRDGKVAPAAVEPSIQAEPSAGELRAQASGGDLGSLLATRLVAELDAAAMKERGGATDADLGAKDMPMAKFSCVFTTSIETEEEFRSLFNELGVGQAVMFLLLGTPVMLFYLVLSLIRRKMHCDKVDEEFMDCTYGLGNLSMVAMVLTIIVLPVLALVLRKVEVARLNLQSILTGLLVMGAFAVTGVAQSSANGVEIYPLVAFILLRARFPIAVGTSVFNLVLFAFYWNASLCPPDKTDDECTMKSEDFAYVIGITALMTAVAGYGGYMRERALRRDFLLQQQLRAEREKSKSMLDNMLPPHITERLSSSPPGTTIADTEPLVSVLFCDIQDFHTIVSKLTPVELVTMLDRVWTKFDELAERHGVQKMETVGYTYMAVGGLQGDGKDAQPVQLARMALDCCSEAAAFMQPDGTPITVKVGLHQGAVLSGVVGFKKPQFSLFGDTVNTTARMQSTGEKMKVHMSGVFRDDYMRHTNDGTLGPEKMSFESRTVTAKGKGEMQTWLCTDISDSRQSSASEAVNRMQSEVDAAEKRRTLGSMRGVGIPSQREMKSQRSKLSSSSGDLDGGGAPPAAALDKLGEAAKSDKRGVGGSIFGGGSKVAALGEEDVALSKLTLRFLESEKSVVVRGRSARNFGRRSGSDASAASSTTAPLTPGGGGGGGGGATDADRIDIKEGGTKDSKASSALSMSMSVASYVTGSELEARYFDFIKDHRLFNVRLGLVITALVMFVVTLPDITDLKTGTSGLLAQVLCRLSISVICCVALFFSLLKWFTPMMSVVTSVVYILMGIAVPLSYSEIFVSGEVRGTIATGIMLLYYSLVGNVSGLNFQDVCVVCGVTLVSWVIIFEAQDCEVWFYEAPNSSTALACGRDPDDEGSDSGVFYYLFMWIFVAVLANLISCNLQETYTRRKYVLMQRLKQETAKTDEFLYKMLPESVVAQMKQSIQVADEFDNVFLLASDVVGFTKMSAASEPIEVVRVLSVLFSAFDAMSEAMGVYKVQTIGDAYIAVTGMGQINRINSTAAASDGYETSDDDERGGVPVVRRHQEDAIALANFALAMLGEIAKVEVPNDRCAPLNMRIGLHVGRVVAGVIGTKKFRYDIWGKDVMTAVLMESSGVPGEVCCSEAMLKYLEGTFTFTPNSLNPTVELKHARQPDGSLQTIDSFQIVRTPPKAS